MSAIAIRPTAPWRISANRSFGTFLLMLALAAPVAAQPPAAAPAPGFENGWGTVPVKPGMPVTARPAPPKAGRDRCIGINTIAGAQMFGDRGLELTMKSGQRYRMFFARDCPALSFYQGFYYKRARAGTLCAGHDAIGARSGGECPIASIIPVRRIRR